MTDNIETDHIPDAGKKVGDANNSANLSNKPFSDEENGNDTETESNVQNVHNTSDFVKVFQDFIKAYERDETRTGQIAGINDSVFLRVSDLEGAIVAFEHQSAALAKSEARVKELEYMRPEVRNFAAAMENSLRSKDIPYGGNSWQKAVTEDEICVHIFDRADVVASKINRANYEQASNDCDMAINEAFSEVAEQAVHLANFAMMLADIAQPQTYRQALKGGAS